MQLETVLVTGAAGFIGSSLAEALVSGSLGATRTRVVGLDNFDPYYDKSIKKRNLANLHRHENFTFVEGDIRDAALLAKLLAEYRPHAVAHLAALAGVRPSLESPDRYMDVNVLGTTRLLEACRNAGVGRFVFASSSSVYGARGVAPFSEDQHVTTPLSPYAASKVAGEAVCYTYHHLYKLGTVCLRYFTVYGPRQRQDLAINKFTRRILAGEPIQLFGDGTTSRDYTFIDDIVRGTVFALESDLEFEVINLGGSHPVTLNELVQQVQEAAGREAIIERLPLQPGDMIRTCADVTKAKELLGWEAQVPLEEGLRRFVQWYRETR